MHKRYKAKKTVIFMAACVMIFAGGLKWYKLQNSASYYDNETEINEGNKVNADFSDGYTNESVLEKTSAGYKNDSSDDIFIIENVPHIWQKESYPTGCESVAAVSLMNYYGMDITVDEFIDCYLKCSYEPCYYGDLLVGESPWESFIGNPRSEYGYGCYAPVIVAAGNEYMQTLDDYGYEFSMVYDMDLSTLCEKYVSQNIPVMVWATIEMMEPETGDSWMLPDGSMFTFIRPEHALLLIGYDDNYYYFSDSMSYYNVTAYEKEACDKAYDGLFRQAIVISKTDY